MPPQFDATPPHQHGEGVKGVGAGESSPLATVLEKVAHNAISIAHFFQITPKVMSFLRVSFPKKEHKTSPNYIYSK